MKSDIDLLKRLDNVRLGLAQPAQTPLTIFARPEVPIEMKAVRELLDVLKISETLERLQTEAPGFCHSQARLEQVAVTPDFHKGSGIPIGTVLATSGFLVPQAIGSDINCGMRLHTTHLNRAEVMEHRDELEQKLRYLFFEGGRNIPMTGRQRQALCQEGLMGLLESVPRSQDEGMWSLFHSTDTEGSLDRVHGLGSLPARPLKGLENYIGDWDRLSRDDQIGSIGGGNHFVEIQVVEKVLDGTTAHAWGLRTDQVVIMAHTGSLTIGSLCGGVYRRMVRELFPSGLRHPENGIFLLPDGRPETELFWDWLHSAANFAFANRMFLALIALRALHEVCGEGPSRLLYDAPHNLVWREGDRYIHRKGACPARGPEEFSGYGEPVLVPGSMGSSSFILAGRGNAEALSSASHGAGRQLSRGEAVHHDERQFQQFLENFRVVTPVDFRKLRSDILKEKLADLKQEAPFAYKGIGPVISTLEDAEIAKPVVELRPLMTVKG